MGKFDKRLRGEKEGERILPGKRAKHTPLTDGAGEKEASGKVLGKLMRCALATSCSIPLTTLTLARHSLATVPTLPLLHMRDDD